MDASAAERGPATLGDVRILDLTWILAGPTCTRLLADQGAQVLKIESLSSMDPIRMGGPWLHGMNTAPDGGGGFTTGNRNKLSVTVNLKQPRGRDLFKALVAVSDVVVNNYSAGTMERLGLGYAELSRVNPGIVVAELSAMGQTGPLARSVAYGQTLMALVGAYEQTGYADGPPVMPHYTYADWAAATIGAFAITAALRWRRTSGLGQYLDLGQLQIGAALMGESQLEALVNHDAPTRRGNSEPGTLLHGCFRCMGEDEWCVISVRTDLEWDALRCVLGDPPALQTRPSLDRPGSDRARIEAAVEDWTAQHSADAVMTLLQGAGIEAAKVQTARDIVETDPHLRQRGFLDEVMHLTGEPVRTEAVPFKMSATPAHVRTAAPIYGIHNEAIFRELLGVSAAAYEELYALQVIDRWTM